MLFTFGHMPGIFNFHARADRLRGLFRASLWALAILVSAAHIAAAEDIPLTLHAAEDIALDREPGQAAMLARAEAFDEESVAAGQLPDPVMRMGLANYPLESGGFTTEGMTQLQLGIRQAFPRGETRQASTRRFESLAREMRSGADSRSRDVLVAVRQAWLDAYYWERARSIVSESRPLFEELVAVTRSLYSVGRRDQQDLLRAELELSRIDDRLIDIDQRHAEASAALSQWIGEQARRPTAEKLPEWSLLPALDELRASLAGHPAVVAADARIGASDAKVDYADSRLKPGWALDLGYGHRNGYLPSGEPRSDFISLMVTLDLPFFSENRQDRLVAAALRERRAAQESREELLRRLDSRLRREHARWQDLSRRLALYDERILSQSRAHAQAALVAYQSDATDFADVARGYINDLETQVEYIRLRAERAKSYAVLADLGGLPR